MSEPERESARSWTLGEAARPPLIGDLVERIDEAVATARASEAAVMTVGAAALDAADQARRAAGAAERASSAALAAGEGVRRAAGDGDRDAEANRLGQFSERADRLVARLQRLQLDPPVPVAAE